MEFILPDSVMNILSRLETDGFSAFVAGGAVRDTIMGKTPHDYDIATSARPEEVKKLSAVRLIRYKARYGYGCSQQDRL